MNSSIDYSTADEVKGDRWLPVYFILLFCAALFGGMLAEESRQRQLETERTGKPRHTVPLGNTWTN